MSEKLIKNYLKKAREKFSVDKLFGGNCGTFAFGLSSFLKDFHNLELEFGFIYEDFSQKHETIREVLNSETRIYHCFLMYNNKMFDGCGFIDNDTLLKFAEDEYSDKYPGCFVNIKANDRDFRLLVSNDTDWSIGEDEYYDFFKKNLIVPKNKKNKLKLNGFF